MKPTWLLVFALESDFFLAFVLKGLRGVKVFVFSGVDGETEGASDGETE